MRINQNIVALSAYRAVSGHQSSVETATERLASGLRINRAADDAAGLAIAESIRTQVKGLNQAQRNTEDSVSLLRTAEGGLNETHAVLQRMRVLAVQAANTGVQSSESLQAIQAEIRQLTSQIDRIAYDTEFNGATLLDGSFRDKSLQIGANAGDTTLVSINSGIRAAIPPSPSGVALWDVYQPAKLAAVSDPVTFSHTVGGQTTSVSVPMPTPRPATVADLAAVLNADPAFSATFSARTGMHRFADGSSVADANLIVMAKAPGAGQVVATGVPATRVQSDPGRDEIPEHVGGYAAADILGYVDVTRLPGSSTNTVTSGGPSTGFGTADDVGSTPTTTTHTSTWGAGATDAIRQIDRAISLVSTGRAQIGAVENALDYNARSVAVSADNLASAESRISDADMAKEITSLEKHKVQLQASIAMLPQANAVPQGLLKLLQ